MKNENILYTIIIYRGQNKLEVYKKEQLIFNNYLESEKLIYQKILQLTRDCKDANKINIEFK